MTNAKSDDSHVLDLSPTLFCDTSENAQNSEDFGTRRTVSPLILTMKLLNI
jgi:hypothetical protein